MKKIVCFHLLNDYSGSPIVLNSVLKQLSLWGYNIDVITSKGGVLDSLTEANVSVKHYPYHFSNNKILTTLKYLYVQVLTFFIAWSYLPKKNTVFYINTLLPVGPAVAGWIMRKKVVYHYHENADIKGCFYKLLSYLMQRIASEIICVSQSQAQGFKRVKNVHVVPNALQKEQSKRLVPHVENAFSVKKILMIASPKIYKGIYEYIELGRMLPSYRFILVLNCTARYVEIIKQRQNPPENLEILSFQADVTPFYNAASIVVNLTNKFMFKETFGMTALEAMTAGLPTIVPTEGGIAELVLDGVTGFRIDVQNLSDIAAKIKQLLSDKEMYSTFSYNAYKLSKNYSIEKSVKKIINII